MARVFPPLRPVHGESKMSKTIREARKAARYFLRLGFPATKEDAESFLRKTEEYQDTPTPNMDRVVEWISAMPEPKGNPEPARPLPWQMMMATYCLSQLDGINLGRQTLVTVPRKQGKTSFAAKLACGILREIKDTGAQIFSIATKEAQAKLVWSDSVNILRRLTPLMLSEPVPELPKIADRLAPEDYGSKGRPRSRKHDDFLLRQRRILKASEQGSYYEFLGKDSRGLDGLFPSFVIIDEAAVVADDVYQVFVSADTGLAASFFHILAISTLNQKNPDGWFSKYILSPDEIKGVNRIRFIPPISDAGDCLLGKGKYQQYGEDEERTWRKLCPAWGTLVDRQIYRELSTQSRVTDEGRREYLHKRINSPSAFDSTALCSPAQARRACNSSHKEQVEKILTEGQSVIGIDLSMTRDATAVACVGWHQHTNKIIAAKTRAYITEKSFSERSARPGGRRLPFFVERGELVIAGDTEINYELVGEQVERWIEQYGARKIYADKMTYGYTFRKLVEQDFRVKIEDLSSRTEKRAASNFWLNLVKNGDFIADANEMLVWEFSNAKSKEWPDGGIDIIRAAENSPNGIDNLYACIHGAFAFIENYNSTPLMMPPPEADTEEKKKEYYTYVFSIWGTDDYPRPEWMTPPDDADEDYFAPERVAERERQRAAYLAKRARDKEPWV